MTNRQIAETLFLAEKTVKNYVSSMLAKLGLQRHTQAALFAATPDTCPNKACHASVDRRTGMGQAPHGYANDRGRTLHGQDDGSRSAVHIPVIRVVVLDQHPSTGPSSGQRSDISPERER